MQHHVVYLDYSATTPVDPRVAEKMIPYLCEKFGNPASRSHAYGWEAEKAVEEARGHIAAYINADPREIVFTSGATESDNLAIKGAAHFYRDKGKHLITVKTEHKAVLDSMRHLETEGYEVTYLDVQENGLIDLEDLKAAIRPDTTLVSVMAVNNEIGVVQDIEAIGNICRERGVLFHCDATQAPGKLIIDTQKLKIDLMSPIPGADMTDRMIMAQVANTTSRMNRVRYGIGTYPAAADFHLLDMACAKAADEKIAYHVGSVISIEHRDQINVAERFARVGVCAIETELNQVYTLSSKAGIPALGIGRVVEPSCDTDGRSLDFKFIDELASFALELVCEYLMA